MMCIHNDLTRALETLETLDPAGQQEFLEMAAFETGGYFKLPAPPEARNTWDSQMVEIKAHGIFVEGWGIGEAMRTWRQCAARQARIIDDLMRAEHILRLPPASTDPARITAACRTIIAESQVASLRALARMTLADQGLVA